MYILTRSKKEHICQKSGSVKEVHKVNEKSKQIKSESVKKEQVSSDENENPKSKNTYVIREVNVKKTKKEKKQEKKVEKSTSKDNDNHNQENEPEEKPKVDDEWQVVKNKKKKI